MADPDYAAYAAWMDRHGPVPRAIAWATGRRERADSLVQPAE
jgi:hypothetical protein